MVCRKVERLLNKFVEGALSGKLKENVAVHLDSCSSCRKERDLLLGSWQMLDDYNAPKLSEDFTSSLMRRIHLEQTEVIKVKYKLPRFILRPLVPVFASVIGVVVVCSLFWKKPQEAKMAILQPLGPKKAATQLAENEIIQEHPQETKVAIVLPLESEKSVTQVVDNEIIKEFPQETKLAMVLPLKPEKAATQLVDNQIIQESSQGKEVIALHTSEPIEVKLSNDKEIIQNIDILQNVDFLQNINVIKELDMIENLDSGTS